jgi:hypothetical protein
MEWLGGIDINIWDPWRDMDNKKKKEVTGIPQCG